jgi:hypothetical protein
VSDLQDRLEKIAERGTPRGFDDVLAAASRRADAVDVVAEVQDEPERARKPRRPYMSMVAAAGITSLLVVGMLAIGSVVGNGGADSPEAAVRQLASAVSHEDPLAAVDVLAPNEVRTLHDSVSVAEQKAQELSLVQTASAPLSGLDLSVDDLSLSTTTLADGYAKVTINGGTFKATTEKAKFSALMQKVLHNYTDNSTELDLTNIASGLSNRPTFVVAVRNGNSWYVSAAYTVLEYAREYNNLPAADFGSGMRDAANLGADSPDAAVKEAMQALAANDWNKLISLAPPNEIPVYDYRAALTQLVAQDHTDTSFTIDSLSTSSQVNGDAAQVTMTAAGKTTDGNAWSWKDGCFTETMSGEGALPECVSSTLQYGPIPESFRQDAQASSTIRAMQVDGRWFVSPTGTALDIIDNVLHHMTREELYTVLRVPQELPPTGTLTLGQPQSFAAGDYAVRALSFSGHAGEKLLGEVSQGTKGLNGPEGAMAIYAADGTPVDAGGMLFGQPATLPSDGTYKVLERVYSPGISTITVWDEADAPASAKNTGGEVCNSSILGESSCGSSSSGPIEGSSTKGILGVGNSSSSSSSGGQTPINAQPGTSPSGELWMCLGNNTGSTPTFDGAGKPVCPSGQTPTDLGTQNGPPDTSCTPTGNQNFCTASTQLP